MGKDTDSLALVDKKTVLDKIKHFIEEGEMSFLIGAGFSRNVNKEAYPLWDELLKDAVWELFGSGNRAKRGKIVLDKALREHGYLGIASMMVKQVGFHEAIDTYIESKTPYLVTEDGKPVLKLNGKTLKSPVSGDCHLLLKRLDIQNIYTFNYDNALEFFMGEESRQALEAQIELMEAELLKLNEKKDILEAREDEQGEERAKIDENRTEINDLRANIETKKQERRTYYNVVKDSCEISLSAKRKSIYKIHGSLRENDSADYGFDGDSHTHYIITQEDYDTYNEKHGAFVNMMRIDLLRNRFCIMGVSGGDANFLAWINWVKDVLDKTRARANKGQQEQHQSYFIYSGNNNPKHEMILMLKNHFIEPVILKDIFPDAKNDNERIKCFLEYIQPLSNETNSRFVDLWLNVDSIRFKERETALTNYVATELFKLSLDNKFYKAHSSVHTISLDVQFAPDKYLKDNAARVGTLVYAAALRCSMLPADLTCHPNHLELFSKEKDENVRDAYRDAVRRTALLQNLLKWSKEIKEGDRYSQIVRGLYNFIFPKAEELRVDGAEKGLDFVRRYSLHKLLNSKEADEDNCNADDFRSPQELVLATDWLRLIGYRNPSLFRKADEFKQEWKLFSLYEYCQSYLRAMKRRKNVSTYGSTSETIYLDRYDLDVMNAAVLLNSFVELGVCFAGNSVLEDKEWLDIVKALKTRYTAALAFYTIARGGNSSVIKAVAQEMMYNEFSRKALSHILKNLMTSLVAGATPYYLKGRMSTLAKEILPAVHLRHWSNLFVASAEIMLDVADKWNAATEIPKSIYGLVAKALEYVDAKSLRLRLIDRIISKDIIKDRLDDHHNTLAIAARKRLTVKDFEPLSLKFVQFAETVMKSSNNQQASFIIVNLIDLIRGEYRPKVLKLLEEQAIMDAYMTEGYVAQIKKYPELVTSFREKFLAGKDLWHANINTDFISVGGVHVNVSHVCRNLNLTEDEIKTVYDNLKKILANIVEVLERPNNPKEDKAWMSYENDFRDIVIDMRLFVHDNKALLKGEDDFDSTNATLMKTYEQCFFGKSVLQLISEDKIYRAIKRVVVEVEINGIQEYQVEYSQLLGKLITKNSKDLGVCFRHLAGAMTTHKKFFDSCEFRKLFDTVLRVYEPYYRDDSPEAWTLIGCQMEVAEKSLMIIAKNLAKWGVRDDFWLKYKKKFN